MPNIPNISIKDNLSFALRESTYIDNRVLAAGVAETITIPTDTDSQTKARYVIFSATGNFWIKMDGVAAVPSSDVVDGSGSSLNPTIREIPSGVTTIGIISEADTKVSMQWFIG